MTESNHNIIDNSSETTTQNDTGSIEFDDTDVVSEEELTDEDFVLSEFSNVSNDSNYINNTSSDITPSNSDPVYNNTSSVTVHTEDETVGNLVWVPTRGGTKYHTNASCSKMKDPKQVTIDTATANGYTPCKKCY